MEHIYNKANRLAKIIFKIRLKKATLEERSFLNGWLGESEENRQLYKKIVRGMAIARQLRREEEIGAETDFERLTGQIVQELKARRRMKRLRWGLVASAACVAGLFIGLGILRNGVQVPPDSGREYIAAASVAEGVKAVLILDNGQQFGLTADISERVSQENVMMKSETGKLVYEATGIAGQDRREVFNQVRTFAGGEYFLVLSDGTKVWLNAESELEFPVEFTQMKRTVRLRGEAYFEVKRDEQRPFLVETEGVRVAVLGTSFNIKAYADEQSIYTTLLTGKVAIEPMRGEATPDRNVVLEPGMQARWLEENGTISVRQVDVSHVMAWREGKFIFTDEDLQNVLRTLARWYDVEFVFPDTETYTFNGMISKDEGLEAVLKDLTLANGLLFKRDGRKIYVLKK